MFIYVHVNEDTGEIVHCFVDNGDDIDFEERIKQGKPPVLWKDAPQNIKTRIIKQEELAEKFADKSVGRFSNDKEEILKELKEQHNPTFDARRIREEIEFVKKDKGLEMRARKKRGKIADDGRAVEE